jgi:hypothetical protein
MGREETEADDIGKHRARVRKIVKEDRELLDDLA